MSLQRLATPKHGGKRPSQNVTERESPVKGVCRFVCQTPRRTCHHRSLRYLSPHSKPCATPPHFLQHHTNTHAHNTPNFLCFNSLRCFSRYFLPKQGWGPFLPPSSPPLMSLAPKKGGEPHRGSTNTLREEGTQKGRVHGGGGDTVIEERRGLTDLELRFEGNWMCWEKIKE